MDTDFKRKVEDNFTKLKIFSIELGLLRQQLDQRIKAFAELQRQPVQGPEGPLPQWDFAYTRFGGQRTDPGANLAVKAFFFVARQMVDRTFHVLYLLRDHLTPEGATPSFPNGSNAKGFAKVYKAVMEEAVPFDGEVLWILREQRDYFIMVRLCRNLLKEVGAFEVHMTNGQVEISIPATAKTRQDPTLQYLGGLTLPPEELVRLRFDPPFLKDCHFMLTETGRVIEAKWRETLQADN